MAIVVGNVFLFQFILCALFLINGTSFKNPLIHLGSLKRNFLRMSTIECKPGSPVIKKLDVDNNIAYMTIAVGGEQTQRAFNKACELFNEVFYFDIFLQYIVILFNVGSEN